MSIWFCDEDSWKRVWWNKNEPQNEKNSEKIWLFRVLLLFLATKIEHIQFALLKLIIAQNFICMSWVILFSSAAAFIVVAAIYVDKRRKKPKRIMREGKLLRSEIVYLDGEKFYVEKVGFKDWHVSIHSFYLISDRLSEGHTIVDQRWSYEDFCNITYVSKITPTRSSVKWKQSPLSAVSDLCRLMNLTVLPYHWLCGNRNRINHKTFAGQDVFLPLVDL